MFQVTRYDPKAEKRKQQCNQVFDDGKRKKRKSENVNKQQAQSQTQIDGPGGGECNRKQKSSLHVIAEDQNRVSPAQLSNSVLLHSVDSRKKRHSSAWLSEEAFNDLDIDVENLIGERMTDITYNEDIHDNNNSNTRNQSHPSTDKNRLAATPKKVNINSLSHHELMVAFRMSQLPLQDASKGLKLAPFLMENLRRDGCTSFFPIQALVIPDVLASEHNAHIRVQDVCITAPTGSGKTLAFVLPILNSIAARITTNPAVNCSSGRRLRALIVLPSRDLATQVHNVFESYAEGSDVKIGLAVGQSHFASEQQALVGNEGQIVGPEFFRSNQLWINPGNLDHAIKIFEQHGTISDYSHQNLNPPRYGWSNVDVLVCTPGRLVDHLDKTPGFTLQHLRFLVVDEADRLLGQSYHNWIDRVMDSANSASIDMWKDIARGKRNRITPIRQHVATGSYVLEPITWRRGGILGDNSHTFNTNNAFDNIAESVCQPVQVRKFLVSATLTKDPRKLASLHLVNPKHFSVNELHAVARSTVNAKDGFYNDETYEAVGSKKYSMPDELEEYIVECTSEQKPIVLLALILDRLQGNRTSSASSSARKPSGAKRLIVVFTSSVDSTHRLTRLLQLLWVAGEYGGIDAIGEFSSSLKQGERSNLLQRADDFNSALSVLVCSDGLSRGMDIRYVDTVINYDVPSLAKTYVHRCGRTARAYTKGIAISLLRKGRQVTFFHKMRSLIVVPDRIRPMVLNKSLVQSVVPKYRQCLASLHDVILAEEQGELGHTAKLPSEFMTFQKVTVSDDQQLCDDDWDDDDHKDMVS